MQWTFHCVARFTLSKRRIYHLLHNEVRETFNKLPGDVCSIIGIESKLQSLEGELFDNKSTSTEDELDYTSKRQSKRASRFKILLCFLQCLQHLRYFLSGTKSGSQRTHAKEAKPPRNKTHIGATYHNYRKSASKILETWPSASKIITRLVLKLSDKASGFIRTKVSFVLLRFHFCVLEGVDLLNTQSLRPSPLWAQSSNRGGARKYSVISLRATQFWSSTQLRDPVNLFYKLVFLLPRFSNLSPRDHYWLCNEAQQLAAYWQLPLLFDNAPL